MKIFIFERIQQVPFRKHSESGLVIIAKDINSAKELIKCDVDIEVTDKEWETVESFDLLKNETPKYWVMPYAGCC